MANAYVDRVVLQNRLFAKLSAMFGAEVPLYDKSLAVNLVCNRAVCESGGGEVPEGFAMDDGTDRGDQCRAARGDPHRPAGRVPVDRAVLRLLRDGAAPASTT